MERLLKQADLTPAKALELISAGRLWLVDDALGQGADDLVEADDESNAQDLWIAHNDPSDPHDGLVWHEAPEEEWDERYQQLRARVRAEQLTPDSTPGQEIRELQDSKTEDNEMIEEDDELTAGQNYEGHWYVEDASLQRWWASPEGNAKINASEDPEATAKELAGDPSAQWGEWHC